MSEGPRPVRTFLVLLLGALWIGGASLLLVLLWLVGHAGLPGWLESLFSIILISFLVPGAKATRRATAPWRQHQPSRL